jgi:hypothetical protein
VPLVFSQSSNVFAHHVQVTYGSVTLPPVLIVTTFVPADHIRYAELGAVSWCRCGGSGRDACNVTRPPLSSVLAIWIENAWRPDRGAREAAACAVGSG